MQSRGGVRAQRCCWWTGVKPAAGRGGDFQPKDKAGLKAAEVLVWKLPCGCTVFWICSMPFCVPHPVLPKGPWHRGLLELLLLLLCSPPSIIEAERGADAAAGGKTAA